MLSLRTFLVSAIFVTCFLGVAPKAGAQQSVDPDARTVLAAMSAYLGSLKSFSVEFSAVDEIVTTGGEKLQFLHSGTITVRRPDNLYVLRRGATGVSETFLDGKTLTLYGKNANAYLQLNASSIDAAIDAVHNLGYDAPGADLLVSKPLDSSTTDMTSGVHMGMTFVDDVEVHQLAFRGSDVDWQLWVTAGEKPLPLRYVVTTKSLPGSPQYTLVLRNWETDPRIDAQQFTFKPQPGATKLDPSSVTINEVGDITMKTK